MLKLKVFSLVAILLIFLSSCEITDDESITPNIKKEQLEKEKLDFGDIIQRDKVGEQSQDNQSNN